MEGSRGNQMRGVTTRRTSQSDNASEMSRSSVEGGGGDKVWVHGSSDDDDDRLKESFSSSSRSSESGSNASFQNILDQVGSPDIDSDMDGEEGDPDNGLGTVSGHAKVSGAKRLDDALLDGDTAAHAMYRALLGHRGAHEGSPSPAALQTATHHVHRNPLQAGSGASSPKSSDGEGQSASRSSSVRDRNTKTPLMRLIERLAGSVQAAKKIRGSRAAASKRRKALNANWSCSRMEMSTLAARWEDHTSTAAHSPLVGGKPQQSHNQTSQTSVTTTSPIASIAAAKHAVPEQPSVTFRSRTMFSCMGFEDPDAEQEYVMFLYRGRRHFLTFCCFVVGIQGFTLATESESLVASVGLFLCLASVMLFGIGVVNFIWFVLGKKLDRSYEAKLTKSRLYEVFCIAFGCLATTVMSGPYFAVSSVCSDRRLFDQRFTSLDGCADYVFPFPMLVNLALVVLLPLRAMFSVPIILCGPLIFAMSWAVAQGTQNAMSAPATGLQLAIHAVMATASAFLACRADRMRRQEFEDDTCVKADARRSILLRRELDHAFEALLPKSVVMRMADRKPVVDYTPNGVVVVAEAHDFANWTTQMLPADVVQVINTLFTSFDEMAKCYLVDKVKAVGDRYVVTCGLQESVSITKRYERQCHLIHKDMRAGLQSTDGLGRSGDDKRPRRNSRHESDSARWQRRVQRECAIRCCIFALQQVQVLQKLNIKLDVPLFMKIAVHSGPLLGALVGSRSIAYDVFGVTLSVALQMARHAPPGCVACSGAVERQFDAFFEVAPMSTPFRTSAAVAGNETAEVEFPWCLLTRLRRVRSSIGSRVRGKHTVDHHAEHEAGSTENEEWNIAALLRQPPRQQARCVVTSAAEGFKIDMDIGSLKHVCSPPPAPAAPATSGLLVIERRPVDGITPPHHLPQQLQPQQQHAHKCSSSSSGSNTSDAEAAVHDDDGDDDDTLAAWKPDPVGLRPPPGDPDVASEKSFVGSAGWSTALKYQERRYNILLRTVWQQQQRPSSVRLTTGAALLRADAEKVRSSQLSRPRRAVTNASGSHMSSSTSSLPMKASRSMIVSTTSLPDDMCTFEGPILDTAPNRAILGKELYHAVAGGLKRVKKLCNAGPRAPDGSLLSLIWASLLLIRKRIGFISYRAGNTLMELHFRGFQCSSMRTVLRFAYSVHAVVLVLLFVAALVDVTLIPRSHRVNAWMYRSSTDAYAASGSRIAKSLTMTANGVELEIQRFAVPLEDVLFSSTSSSNAAAVPLGIVALMVVAYRFNLLRGSIWIPSARLDALALTLSMTAAIVGLSCLPSCIVNANLEYLMIYFIMLAGVMVPSTLLVLHVLLATGVATFLCSFLMTADRLSPSSTLYASFVMGLIGVVVMSFLSGLYTRGHYEAMCLTSALLRASDDDLAIQRITQTMMFPRHVLGLVNDLCLGIADLNHVFLQSISDLITLEIRLDALTEVVMRDDGTIPILAVRYAEHANLVIETCVSEANERARKRRPKLIGSRDVLFRVSSFGDTILYGGPLDDLSEEAAAADDEASSALLVLGSVVEGLRYHDRDSSNSDPTSNSTHEEAESDATNKKQFTSWKRASVSSAALRTSSRQARRKDGPGAQASDRVAPTAALARSTTRGGYQDGMNVVPQLTVNHSMPAGDDLSLRSATDERDADTTHMIIGADELQRNVKRSMLTKTLDQRRGGSESDFKLNSSSAATFLDDTCVLQEEPSLAALEEWEIEERRSWECSRAVMHVLSCLHSLRLREAKMQGLSAPSSLDRQSPGSAAVCISSSNLQESSTEQPFGYGEGSSAASVTSAPAVAVAMTCIASSGPGFATVLGSRRVSFNIFGAAARQSAVLLEAAPKGFFGCTDSFLRIARDAAVPIPMPQNRLCLGISHRWRVRGAGIQTMHSLVDVAQAGVFRSAIPIELGALPSDDRQAVSTGNSVALDLRQEDRENLAGLLSRTDREAFQFQTRSPQDEEEACRLDDEVSDSSLSSDAEVAQNTAVRKEKKITTRIIDFDFLQP